MRTIYKYPIIAPGSCMLQVPGFAGPMHVGLDPTGTPCIWLAVDTELHIDVVHVIVIGTGFPIPSEKKFRPLGSFVKGEYVWHVFLST